MKKTISNYFSGMDPVKLDLMDIGNIVEIVQSVCETVEISTSGVVFDNVEDIKNLQIETLTELKIEGYSPYISLEFSPSRIWLYIAEDTPISRGALEQVRTVLLKSRHRFWILIKNSRKITILLILFIVFLFSFNLGSNKPNVIINYLDIILSICCILVWITCSPILRKKYSQIFILERKNNSFWRKKRDDIKLAVFTGILGIIAGYIIGLIT